MSLPPSDVLDYLRANPRASRQEVMRALGVSAKDVQRAEQRLDDQRHRARRRRKQLLASVVGLGVAGGLAVGIHALVTAPAPPPTSEEVQAAERALYQALDERDPGRVADARRNLSSPDERVRLAALRYLATVAPSPALLELFDDPSARVRRASLQLAGERVAGAERALLTVAAAAERPLEERTLALNGLRAREVAEPRVLARELLPLLRDETAPLRLQVPSLLEYLTQQRVETADDSPEAVYAAWAAALQETP